MYQRSKISDQVKDIDCDSLISGGFQAAVHYSGLKGQLMVSKVSTDSNQVKLKEKTSQKNILKLYFTKIFKNPFWMYPTS